MADRDGLLLDFMRAAAHHSAVRGDDLSDLLRSAVTALRAGTGAPHVGWVPQAPSGLDVLLTHELGLPAAVAASGTDLLDPDEVSGNATPIQVLPPPMWIDVRGHESVLGRLQLAPPPSGWATDGADERFAAQVVEELREVLLRHWSERQHLDRSAAMLEAQRHTHVGCFEWDIVADKVRWSDELFRIFGAEPQSFEPTFEEFLERIHPDDREAVRASVYSAYEERRDYRIEERIVRPDGTVRQLASWGHVIVDETTTPVKIIGSCQDITEPRATMADLARAERFLAEAEERRARALELNDNVVQGLAAALYALHLDRVEDSRTELAASLEAARTIIDQMLAGGGEAPFGAGLLRQRPAPSNLVPQDRAPRQGPSTELVRVVIADDASDIRFLTSIILASDPGFDVVAEAENGAEAVTLVATHRPHLVLLDLAMPVLDGLSAIPELLAASPDTVIVVFSGFHAGAAAGEALERGAHAFIEKGQIDTALPDVLRSILSEVATARPAKGTTAAGQ